MNKQNIVTAIIDELRRELDVATQAATTAYETATHSESVAENKYDTFGLEASYLAAGQNQRIMDLRSAIIVYDGLEPRAFSDSEPAGVGAVITLESATGEERRIFLSPTFGGLRASVNGETIQVVTRDAPLGRAIQDMMVGDEIKVANETFVITGIE